MGDASVRAALVALVALSVGCASCSSDSGEGSAPAPDAEADASVVDDATAGEDTEDDETGVDAPDVPEEDITPDTTPGPNIDLEAGRADYETFCGFCHGDDGEGYLADNANALSNAHFLASASDEFLRLSTIYGRPGTPMSPWGEVQGGPLSDAQVDNIVAYIRQWQTTPSVDVDIGDVDGGALLGQSVYNVFCDDCHGADGEGVTAVSLNNPWFHEVASDGFIRYAIEEGRPGTSMPAYADQLNDVQIDNLVAYIRSWRTDPNAEPIEPFEPDLANAVLNPDGADAEFTLRDGRFAPAAEVEEALRAGQRFILIDARPTADYLESHISGATSFPFYDIDETSIEALARDAWVITYCGCPHAVSGQAADALLAAGFERVAVLDEGFYYWEEQGWPLTSGRETGAE